MKPLNGWLKVRVIIYSFNVIESSAEEHAPSLASRSILRSLPFTISIMPILGSAQKATRPRFRVENRLTVPRAQTI